MHHLHSHKQLHTTLGTRKSPTRDTVTDRRTNADVTRGNRKKTGNREKTEGKRGESEKKRKEKRGKGWRREGCHCRRRCRRVGERESSRTGLLPKAVVTIGAARSHLHHRRLGLSPLCFITAVARRGEREGKIHNWPREGGGESRRTRWWVFSSPPLWELATTVKMNRGKHSCSWFSFCFTFGFCSVLASSFSSDY
ncbi:hypothetical protein AHAS_Ahas18G0097100 [Arachis hypogaea]